MFNLEDTSITTICSNQRVLKWHKRHSPTMKLAHHKEAEACLLLTFNAWKQYTSLKCESKWGKDTKMQSQQESRELAMLNMEMDQMTASTYDTPDMPCTHSGMISLSFQMRSGQNHHKVKRLCYLSMSQRCYGALYAAHTQLEWVWHGSLQQGWYAQIVHAKIWSLQQGWYAQL